MKELSTFVLMRVPTNEETFHTALKEHDDKKSTTKYIQPVQSFPKLYLQQGVVEELSTWYYLDTALLNSSESVLSETKIFNIKIIDAHFKS